MTTARAIRLAFAAPFAFAALLAAGPGAVLADCAALPEITEEVNTADIVFLGTVTGLTNNGRRAEVAVEEVWRGPDQPQSVVIRAGPEGNGVSSVDRSFEVGVRYLFFPYLDTGTQALADNSCTNTSPWSLPLSDLRPVDIRLPIGASPPGAGFDFGPLMPFVAAAVVFLALLGIGLLARGRQAS